jgi:Ohr subfamily peroxiredoxin
MKQLYTAHASVTGGRNGNGKTDDGNLSVTLSSPGSGKSGTTNPEQLFACGYAACFGSAIEAVTKMEKATVGDITVNADVTLNQDDNHGYFLAVTLNVTIAGAEQAQANALVEKAHQMCPYSKATRGNIEVTLKVNDQPLAKAA